MARSAEKSKVAVAYARLSRKGSSLAERTDRLEPLGRIELPAFRLQNGCSAD